MPVGKMNEPYGLLSSYIGDWEKGQVGHRLPPDNSSMHLLAQTIVSERVKRQLIQAAVATTEPFRSSLRHLPIVVTFQLLQAIPAVGTALEDR